jgi:hypothetical protein
MRFQAQPWRRFSVPARRQLRGQTRRTGARQLSDAAGPSPARVASAVGLALAETEADGDPGRRWAVGRRRQPRWTALSPPFGARANPHQRPSRAPGTGFRFRPRRDHVWRHEQATGQGRDGPGWRRVCEGSGGCRLNISVAASYARFCTPFGRPAPARAPPCAAACSWSAAFRNHPAVHARLSPRCMASPGTAPCMAIVTAARNGARRRTDARPNCG